MPPQATDPTASGVLFETDTQTEDLGLAKDVSRLKKAGPKKYEYFWGNIAWFLFLHIGSVYGIYLALTQAKWQTNVFGKHHLKLTPNHMILFKRTLTLWHGFFFKLFKKEEKVAVIAKVLIN